MALTRPVYYCARRQLASFDPVGHGAHVCLRRSTSPTTEACVFHAGCAGYLNYPLQRVTLRNLRTMSELKPYGDNQNFYV